MLRHPMSEVDNLFALTDATDVLLVQEDADLRASWASALRHAGYVPEPVDSVEAMFEALLDYRHWRAIVVDLGFRGAEATVFLNRLRAEGHPIPLVLTAWDESVSLAKPAKAYPGLAFAPAPVQPRELAAAISALPAPPPKKVVRPSSGLISVNRVDGIVQAADSGRLKDTLLPHAAAARAEAERDAAEAASAPKTDTRISHEMERAREIQSRLLPTEIPQPKGFEIAAQYLPAEHVGGDYYDVITLPDGRIAMLVADVSGKGISAAMVMVMARTVFHSVAPGAADARQLVTLAADRIAKDLPGGIFISLACGLLDPATGTVSVVNAGHLPPLHWSILERTPFVSTLDVAGGAIGLVKGALFQRTLRDASVTLEPGEQLVFFTDGVNEAMDEKNEEYGDKRLHKAVKANGCLSAADLAQGIVDSVLYYRGDAPASDDITVLVVKRR
ncbi:MAG: SpoIIE family protein phosphatase [Planctomycetes bacterium]|nr:SpoIIE family protein phosphatase [Planctomycetota bacterium]